MPVSFFSGLDPKFAKHARPTLLWEVYKGTGNKVVGLELPYRPSEISISQEAEYSFSEETSLSYADRLTKDDYGWGPQEISISFLLDDSDRKGVAPTADDSTNMLMQVLSTLTQPIESTTEVSVEVDTSAKGAFMTAYTSWKASNSTWDMSGFLSSQGLASTTTLATGAQTLTGELKSSTSGTLDADEKLWSHGAKPSGVVPWEFYTKKILATTTGDPPDSKPALVKFLWGVLKFTGWVTSLEFSIIAVDKDGAPRRVEVSMSIQGAAFIDTMMPPRPYGDGPKGPQRMQLVNGSGGDPLAALGNLSNLTNLSELTSLSKLNDINTTLGARSNLSKLDNLSGLGGKLDALSSAFKTGSRGRVRRGSGTRVSSLRKRFEN